MGLKLAYSTQEFGSNFAAAFCPPHSAVGTPAQVVERLGLFERHTMREVHTGCGLDGSGHVACSCGWRGPVRQQADDYQCTGLANDAQQHWASARGLA